MSGEAGEWKSGLTWRVVLATIYSAVVLLPTLIWAELMIGPPPVDLTWAVVILFYWLALMYGAPLSKQELLVMFAAVGTAAYAGVGLDFPSAFYRVWFSNSPIVHAYGISELLPYWWVPKNELIRAQVIRTFLHPEWGPVILFSMIFWILSLVMGISLGFFYYYLYTEVEKLPWPMARVNVEILSVLESREPERMRIFVLSALIGFVYSMIAYGTPILSQSLIGLRIEIIPIPWLDMSEAFQDVLPGAMVGLDTNPLNYLLGIVLPWYHLIVCMFATSLFVSLIGNPMVVWYFPYLIPKWVEFPKGMKLPDILYWSNLYIWIAVSIGAGFAVFVEQIIARRKSLYMTFKSLYKPSSALKLAGGLSFKSILGIYLVGTLVWFLLLELILIPGFPMLPLLFLIVVWPALYGLISIRAYAETGLSIPAPPEFANNILIATMMAYNIPVHSKLGIWPWFAPLGVPTGFEWARRFYICSGVRCTFRSYIKAVYLVAAPVAMLLNFIFSEFIWKMSYIPSPMFPYAQIFWPLRAARSVLWYTRQIYSLNPMLIIYSFIIVLGMSSVANILHIPISTIGIMTGIQPLPTPLAMFIGATLRKIVYHASKGRIDLRKYGYMMLGGFAMGLSVAIAISVSIAIFLKSIWPLPY